MTGAAAELTQFDVWRAWLCSEFLHGAYGGLVDHAVVRNGPVQVRTAAAKLQRNDLLTADDWHALVIVFHFMRPRHLCQAVAGGDVGCDWQIATIAAADLRLVRRWDGLPILHEFDDAAQLVDVEHERRHAERRSETGFVAPLAMRPIFLTDAVGDFARYFAIDGNHRLRAAILRGDAVVSVFVGVVAAPHTLSDAINKFDD